ncbi:hypothetical protein [Burkholderia sp. Ac-20379]|uniref:hypothetical protein n=1 Tax=Burkholderia sp. Ac-20379 TaxID=2703900 RepID=UPI00197EB9DB|nr:hypothetical protein [Burkholderia sp. Ac-20379]MBN3724822.1 hypothetical protein [Burkholderia sp. Ac-20379]
MPQPAAALAIRFPAERLNDGAGDPYWIDFTFDEAHQLHAQLAAQRAGAQAARTADATAFTLA